MATTDIIFGINDDENNEEYTSKSMIRFSPNQNSIISVPNDRLKKSIIESLECFLELFDDDVIKNSKAKISEIELGINIGVNGKVSIASIVEGGSDSLVTVKVKLTGKDNEQI